MGSKGYMVIEGMGERGDLLIYRAVPVEGIAPRDYRSSVAAYPLAESEEDALAQFSVMVKGLVAREIVLGEVEGK